MLNGTKKLVELADGTIRVTLPSGLSPGKFIRLIGKGISDSVTRKQGDLLLKVVQAEHVLDNQVGTADARCAILIQSAKKMIANGNYPKAIRELRDLLLIEPNNSLAHNLIGSVYLSTTQSTMAKIHFRKALDIDPENLTALEGLKQVQSAYRDEPDSFMNGLFGLSG